MLELYSRLDNGRLVLRAHEDSLEQNQKALAGITASEKAGLADIRDVLESEQSTLQAKLAHSRALHNVYLQRLLIKLHLGEINLDKTQLQFTE